MKPTEEQSGKKGNTLLQGEIRYLEKGADYGLIESGDGHHVYFHHSDVVGMDVSRLRTGDLVVFTMTTERQVPQATKVYPAGKDFFHER